MSGGWNARAREVFARAHGPGPHTCDECGQTIDANLAVHHRDEDQTNNALTNLAPLHRACHNRVHDVARFLPSGAETTARQTGRVLSAETRAKIAAKARGRKTGPRPAEVRERIAAGQRAAWERRKSC